MSKDAFIAAYERLNQAQKEAVDTIEGPVMVVAGPGTGKTQILTLRIANILRKTDAMPENILALTFTEAGARAMRERLTAYIGQAAYRVNIHTFHEFAGNLIRQYPDSYLRAVGGRPASDLEKISILETIIETGQIRALRPHGNPAFYIKPITSALALLKREYITPDALATIIVEQEARLAEEPQWHEKGAHKGKVRGDYQKLQKELERNRELLFVYRAYTAALTTERLYDFEDMIFETVEALEKNEDMLRDLQERYHYILADEHQDVNGSQNRILELLASFHDRPNLFVVGDEKQAIYRFQGASLENFLFFEEKFPYTKTIALTDNYRSVQKVLDLAQCIITEVDTPASALRVPLTAHTQESGSITRQVFSHEAIEDESVLDTVASLLASGVLSSEIALILRSNKEVEMFASALRMRGISTRASADGDILFHPLTTAVRTLLSTILEPGNEAALFAALHLPCLGILPGDLVLVLRGRSYDRPLAQLLLDTEYLASLSLQNREAFTNFMTILTEARKQMLVEAPHRVLQSVLTASGFLEYVLKTDVLESGRVLRRLYDEIESLVRTHEMTTLYEVAAMFASRTAHGLPLNAPYIETTTEAVSVMTAHKSKGLEFAHVFIPHLNDARWGDTSRPNYFKIPLTKQVDDSQFGMLDDERKLLYVAMTRAKVGLYLSSARQNTAGRPFTETPLLASIESKAITDLSTEAKEAAFDPTKVLSQLIPVAVAIDIEILKMTLKERGLSATSLNNYLKSPWNYLYRNVLRIPELQGESAQFGTALHNTLRRVSSYYKQHEKVPSTAEIKTYLEHELGRLPLLVHEFTRLHARGLEALVLYLAQVTSTWPKTSREEVKFEAVLPTGDVSFPEVRLTGNLDRLDIDAEGRIIRVVDYKSGKPKTRGYIEGTTKDSSGDYKRQLTFYALLLSLQSDDRLHCRNGLLSFFEADEKGVIHEEAYTITDEEIAILKQDIIRVAREISQGAFLTTVCDPEQSEYCHLVEQLRR